MMKTTILTILLIAGALTLHAATPEKPNIVFILADDLGWADTSLYGHTRLYQTPNIERLAKRGMTFTRAYSASPLCSPTRSAILTGLSPARTGITTPNCHLPQVVLAATPGTKAPPNKKEIMPEPVTRLKTDYRTLAESLKEAGYATGHFGKWHLGPEPYSPLQHGFDVDVPHWPGPGPAGSFVAPWKFKDFDADPAEPNQHLEDRMAREAVAFMEKHKDGPFFLNYWMFSVHAPFDAKKDLIEKHRARVDPADPQRSPTYAAMIESMDDAVGTLLDTLDRLKIADNTIIVFTSDNGGNMYNEVDGTTPTSNAPLRGGKATMFEGGTRVPCVIDWPGVTAPGTRSDAIIQSEDFYPTILAGLKLKPAPDQKFDGISILPALEGRDLDRAAIFQYFPHDPGVPDWLPPAASVHRGDWKLIRIFHGGDAGAHRYLLFNLHDDPGEKNNLAARNPEMVQELDALITQFLADTKAVVPIPNPAFDPAKYRPELEGVQAAKKKAKPTAAGPPAPAPAKPAPNISGRNRPEDLLVLDNGTAKVGIDRNKGASITWLSWASHPTNIINLSDPGRLLQQSYYAGQRLDRQAEGQSKSWSPWSWNPIQGGGVGSWARVTGFRRLDDGTLFGETIPKLWDMPDEEAAAVMRQWTGFEPDMPNVVVVRCEFVSKREQNDRWGSAKLSPQEIPACYFTRKFSRFRSYLGDGQWRDENQPPGPPWGKAEPPLKAMACFAAGGQGIAVFSPVATQPWNFGPHGGGASDDPAAGPCAHMAPIDRVPMGPQSTYTYRYWLVVGTEAEIAAHLDALWEKYGAEKAQLSGPSSNP